MQDDTFTTLSALLIPVTIVVVGIDSVPVWRRQYNVTDKNIWEDAILRRIYNHQITLITIVLITTSVSAILASIDLHMSGVAFVVSLSVSLLCMDVSQQFTHRIDRLIHPVPY